MMEEVLVTFKFKREDPITITCNTTNNLYVAGNKSYNSDLKKSKQSWHLITIFHHNKCSKTDILNSIFKIVEDNEFFPVGYKEGQISDCFLVRQCWDAIDKLFQAKLLLYIPKLKDQKIYMKILINATVFSFGQISPVNKLHETIGIQVQYLISQNGVRKVLDLHNLNKHPHLEDVNIFLGNKAVFKHLCTYLKDPRLDILSSINGINLRENGISSLADLKILDGAKLQLLNLQNNNITQIDELYYIVHLQITELYLSGNPICNKNDFISHISKIFPNLKKIDFENDQITPAPSSSRRDNNVSNRFDSFSSVCNGVPVTSYSSLLKFSISDQWHQIIVEHFGNFNKIEIAEHFFQFFSSQQISNDFFLCYYKNGKDEDNFLVRNCFENLKALAQNDFKIKNSVTQEQLPIKINMNYSPFEHGQIDPNNLMLEIATTKCYNPIDRCLNLAKFNERTEMKNLYINISNPKIYSNILQHCGRKHLSHIVEVRLGHNKISNCKGLKSLNTMRNLKVLMLNNNRIKYIKDLEYISHTNITELRLDGNPLCKSYLLATDYIKDTVELFPDLKKLDGIAVETDSTILNSRKNFIFSLEAYDVTEQFVGNYFRMYDSKKRIDLTDMYHKNAIFTLCFYYESKKSIDPERFGIYLDYERNLKKTSRVHKNLFHGIDNVMKVLFNLPKTEHDFFSFTTDTSVYNENMIVITVTGVFKDISANGALEPDILMGFSRTFVLCPISKVGLFRSTIEYEITNEQFTIYNPSESQVKNSFKFIPHELDLNFVAKENEDKIAYVVMLQQLTKLKEVWVTRCLDQGGWDFENALQYFLDEMEKGGIPQQAFLENLTS